MKMYGLRRLASVVSMLTLLFAIPASASWAGSPSTTVPYLGPTAATVWSKDKGGGGGLVFTAGYRHDDFFWNIDGGPGGVNILSELTWSDLEIIEVGSMYRAWSPNGLYLRGSISFGIIFDGENQDSDYNGNDRTLEYSRSNNSSDSGSVFDATGAIGYAIKPMPWFIVAPVVGYSYHEQNLDITDGFQTIPATGPFPNLDSSYDASWYGDWVGLDVIIERGPVAFAGTAEYHWAEYYAEANWNLISTFAHPVSFEHTADGYGMVYKAALDYRLTDRIALGLSGGYSFWRAKNGIDRTFLAAGGYTEQGFNEVELESYSAGLAFNYMF